MSSFNGNSGPNTGRFGVRRPDGTFVPFSFGNSNLSDPFGAGSAERELNNLFGNLRMGGPAAREFGDLFGMNVSSGQSGRGTATSNDKTNTKTKSATGNETDTELREVGDEITYPVWWSKGSPEPSEGVVFHADSSGSKDTEVRYENPHCIRFPIWFESDNEGPTEGVIFVDSNGDFRIESPPATSKGKEHASEDQERREEGNNQQHLPIN